MILNQHKSTLRPEKERLHLPVPYGSKRDRANPQLTSPAPTSCTRARIPSLATLSRRGPTCQKPVASRPGPLRTTKDATTLPLHPPVGESSSPTAACFRACDGWRRRTIVGEVSSVSLVRRSVWFVCQSVGKIMPMLSVGFGQSTASLAWPPSRYIITFCGTYS